jgi:hypothetical protein
MIELTAECFNELCGEAPVRDQIGSLDTHRRAAMRKFWLCLAGGVLLAPLGWKALYALGWPNAAIVAAIVLVSIGFFTGYSALARVGESLKHPVLEAIAARAGLEYIATGFSPPVYPIAGKALFGSGFSSETFTDLFHGSDADGHGYAVYEASLQRRTGRNTHIVFTGQIYALQRRALTRGRTAILPDKGILNFFKPASDMERVRIGAPEAEFEDRFEVYSTAPAEATQLLFDTDLRRTLLDLRRQWGRVHVWLDPENVLVAIVGPNHFEPGSMFRSRAGEERVRSMLDDVCASLAVLRDLKARLG